MLESIPDLSGRVAIVTGSSRGIGKEIALALARAGAAVVVAAKSTAARPDLPGTIGETAEAIEAAGGQALAVACDVRQEEQVRAMVERCVEEFGRVDILINNAGALWWKDLRETPMERFDLVMNVNARAAFCAAYHCLPHMREQKWGHIINMSPPIDLDMVPGKVAYSISKFGMTLIAHGLAEEVREDHIAVNALWPATVIESQASINFGLGGPKDWRKPSIVSDATLAILQHEPPSLTGQALIDEEILAAVGVTDLRAYLCVEGGRPLRIAGRGGSLNRLPNVEVGGPATHGPGVEEGAEE